MVITMLVRITFELADKDKNIYREIKNSFLKEGVTTTDFSSPFVIVQYNAV